MKKILFLLVIICTIFIFTGCDKYNMIGNYKIVEVIEGETIIKGSELKDKKIDYTLKIKSDNTAVLTINESIKLKYNDKYFYSINDKNDRILYSHKDNRITLDVDELKLVFEKK